MKLGILVLVLMIGLGSAISVCIDNVAPSAPGSLSVSGSVGNILISWDASTDEPDCSGIDYYNISRDGDWIGQVNGDVLKFVDNEILGAGEYDYTVFAVDMVGHNTGKAIKNNINVDKKGRTSGGSSSHSYICKEKWVCGNWTDCIGNEQRRLCEDLNKCGPENDKPITYLKCGTEDDSDSDMTLINTDTGNNTENHANFLSTITGAVTGVVGTAGGIGVIVFMVLVCGGFVAIRIRKKR